MKHDIKMQLTATVDKTPYKTSLSSTVDKTPSKTQLTLTVEQQLNRVMTCPADNSEV